nr:hypothetical protein [Tanacetum cinerariifolium]
MATCGKKKAIAETEPPAHDPHDVETIKRLQQRIKELEFQQDSPAEETKTESNVWDDGSEDANPFGGGNHDNPLRRNRVLFTIPIMKKKMPVYKTDIEDVIEEEEGYLGMENSIATFCLETVRGANPIDNNVDISKAEMKERLKKDLKISLENIKMATQEFSHENCVGSGIDWKVYKGELLHAKDNANATGRTTIVAKQWIQKSEFLHGGGVTQQKLVHGNIKSANILLTADEKAKISNFKFLSLDSLHQHMDHVSDNAYGTFAYLDPEYAISGFLTDRSDLYSFGIILLDILCVRLAWGKGCEDHSQSLGPLSKRRFKERNFGEIDFEGIKQEIVPESYSSFVNIAYECLHDVGYKQLEEREVVLQLKEALEFQKDKEIWEPMLPRNYREIIDMSKTPGSTLLIRKRISTGCFLMACSFKKENEVNDKKHVMISTTKVLFNSLKMKFLHLKPSAESRFQNLMELLPQQVFRIKYKTELLGHYNVSATFDVSNLAAYSGERVKMKKTQGRVFLE